MQSVLYGPHNDLTLCKTGKLKDMLADLIWLNALIATELIQVTENRLGNSQEIPPARKLPSGAQRTP